MTKKELKKSEQLLLPYCTRTSTAQVDKSIGSGQCLTAYFNDGGQKIFWSLDQVVEFLRSITPREKKK